MHRRIRRTAFVLAAVCFAAAAAFAQSTGTALVRHAPSANGTIDGSVQQMLAENVTLNGGAVVTRDLLVPGTPTVRLNGHPSYGGTIEGTGAVTPTSHQVTLNGNVSLRNVVRRTNAVALPVVSAPPASAGTRSVTITSSNQSAGDFATLRNLTLNGNVGQFAIPPGTYGDFTANGGSGFTLGVAGATQPSVYHFQRLTLNGQTEVQIVGPVVITVANGFTANGTVGSSANPSRLTLNIYSGGLTLNGSCRVHGYVNAPNGAVVVNGNSQLIGGVTSDHLTVNGGGLLRLQPFETSNQPPVAHAQTLSTNEDTAKAIVLTGSDPDASPLAFAVVSPPARGTLSGTAPNLTYTPATNYHGPDSFTFKVNDGQVDSAVATVSLTIIALNDPPVADAKAIPAFDEDTSASITLTGTDVEGSALTFAITTPPVRGTLSGSGANLTYTPNPNYHGPDQFHYTANDGSATSAPALVTLTVRSVNDAPVAATFTKAGMENTAIPVVLVGTDVEGDALTYSHTLPANGMLTGTAPNLTYRSAANFSGTDSFTYKVNDGQVDSGIAMVTLAINNPNDPPAATPQSVTTPEDTARVITLAGIDPDGHSLTFEIVAAPLHGTLSGTGASRTYTPAANYHGPDSFTFRASDAEFSSSPATVSITVTPVDDAPVANAQTLQTAEDTALSVALTGSDIEGSALSFLIVTSPQHGTLTGSGANRIYTPAANYSGPDSFSFKVNDGALDSPPATVALNVTPVNDAPVATAQTVAAVEDTALTISLSGTDVENSALAFTVVTPPQHGTYTLVGATFTYTPATNYHGSDTFAFKASDGELESTLAATITVTIAPQNDAPAAANQSANIPENAPASLTLGATDVDGDPLTYAFTSPAHGTLSGTAPNLTYTPFTNYVGPDSFTFTATDSANAVSNSATVSITVFDVNTAPTAANQVFELDEDTSRSFALSAADADNDALSYTILTPPANGVLAGIPATPTTTAPTITYIPGANFFGTDSFTYQVRDGNPTPASATVTFTVRPINDVPVANAQAVTTAEDTSRTVVLTGSDPENSALSFVVLTSPTRGTLSGSAPNLTYTPNPNTFGSDSFTFRVNDGDSDSAPATVSVNVTPVNDAPVVTAASITVTEDTAKSITLAGTDADGDALTFLIVSHPQNGALSGTPPQLTYTPNQNYFGPDSFSYKARDTALADSAVAVVSLTVSPVNDAPVATPISIITAEDTPKAITLAATDAEGDALTFVIVGQPQKGSLSGAAPNLTYIPSANVHGTDTFTFRARDVALAESAIETVSITITPVNDAPVAVGQSVIVSHNTATTVFLGGSDIENDALTFAIVSPPAQGVVAPSGSPAPANSFVYTPATGFTGADSFTFKVNDGAADSATATVTLDVQPPPNLPPVFTSTPISVFEIRADLGNAGLLRGRIRDFSKTHPNFEHYNFDSVQISTGVVGTWLGTDRKPVPANLGGMSSTDTPENFNQWFNDVPGVNFARTFDLPVAETAPGSGIFTFRSDAFFPIDNEFYGPEGLTDGTTLHNFNFTCEFHTNFIYQPGQTIIFGGDDSIWVFVNDRLVIDLGGVHLSAEQTTTLDHLGMVPGRVYPMDIFYAEQHTGGASFRLRTNFGFETQETYRYAAVAADPENSAVTYSLLQAPPGMTIEAQSGVITWVVNRGNAGNYPVIVQARDAGGLTATQSYTLTAYVNAPPIITPTRYVAGRVGEPIGLVAAVADDGYPAPPAVSTTWSRLAGPGNVAIANPTLASTTATFTAAGIHIMQVRASDGTRASLTTVEARVEAASPVGLSGAVSWWPGNNSPEDVIGGRHAQLYLGADYEPGKVASGFKFDGVDDVARVPANPDLNVGTSGLGFSLEFWMRCDIESPLATVFAWQGKTGAIGVNLALDRFVGNPRLGVGLRAIDGTSTDVTLEGMWSTGQWTHLAVTYDRPAGVVRVYRDGNLRAERVVGNLALQTSYDFTWGCITGFNGNFFRGALDEVALYRRPLSHEEVQSSYSATAGRRPHSGNTVPVANAGPDRALRAAGEAITLNGSTADADGKPAALTSAWTLASGPASPIFSNAASATTNATFPAAGTYVLKLSASDGEASVSDLTEVRVAQNAAAAPPGLIGWWPGNQTPLDLVNGLHAQWINDPAYATGRVSDAFSIDGTRRLFVPASPTLNAATWPGLSVEFWVRPSGMTTNGEILQWRRPDGTTGVSIGMTNFFGWRLGVDLRDTAGQPHSFHLDGFFTEDIWQHVVVAYDQASGVARVYRDGLLRHEVVVGTFTPQTTYDLVWGGRADGGVGFKGLIDEVAVYNRALSSEDIQAAVTAGPAGRSPGANLPPVVAAGPPQIVRRASDTATLAGTVSDDALPVGNTVRSLWSKVSGPGEVSFGNAATAATTATFTLPGLYVLRLEADDGLLRASALTEVRVEFSAPVATSVTTAAWWPGNGTALDRIGSAHAQWIGPAAYASGTVAQAFEVSANGYLRVPVAPSLAAESWSGITVEGWVYPRSASPFNVPMIEWRDLNGALISLRFTNSFGARQLRLEMKDAGGAVQAIEPANSIATDAWQHVAFSYDRATGIARLFRNGGMIASANFGSFAPRTTGDLFFGSAQGFQGVLDEIAVHSRALTPSEIGALANAAGAGRVTAPVNRVVTAGPDRILRSVTDVLSLSGTATEGGASLPVAWSCLTGPAVPVFGDTLATATTVTFPAPGIYVLALTADDGRLRTQDVTEVRVASLCTGDSLPGLAFWWPMTGAPTEIVRGGHDLQPASGTAYVTGPVGAALSFVNSAGPTVVTSHADLDLGASAAGFSLELWFRPGSSGNQPLLLWHNGTQDGVVLHLVNGGARVAALLVDGAGASQQIESGPSITTGSWHHVALVYDRPAGTASLYLNGNLAATSTIGQLRLLTTYDLYLGGRASHATARYTGALDEVTGYTRPLTAAEVGTIWQAGPAGKVPPGAHAPQVLASNTPVLVSSGLTTALAGTASDTDFPPGFGLATRWLPFDGPGAPVFADATSLTSQVTFPVAGLYLLRLVADDGLTSATSFVEVRAGLPSTPQTLPELVAWWPGNLTPVERIHGRDLQPGSFGYTPGKVARAFQFDGSGNFGRVPANPNTNIGAAPAFTIELWVKPDEQRSQSRMLTWWNGTTEGVILMQWFNARVGLFVRNTAGDGPGITTVAPTPFDDWTHVAFTYERSTGLLKAYVNGSFDSQQAGITVPETSFDLYFGSRAGSSSFRGGMDEVSFYTKALSAAEISAIYQAGAGGKFLPPNQAPVVNAGVDVAGTVNAAVPFNGSVTDDGLPAGGALTSQWTKVSGPGAVTFGNAAQAATTASFASAGTYVLRLTASDSVLSSFDEVTATITSTPPVVAFYEPANNASLPASVSFDLAVRATDADGTIAKVEFFQGATKLGEQTAPEAGDPTSYFWTVTGGLPVGSYSFTARATDNNGVSTTTAALTITVVADPGPPVAEYGAPAEDARITQPTTVTGVASSPLIASWKVEQRLKATDGQPEPAWTTFASGTTSVGTPANGSAPAVPGAFGTFDPTSLLNGIYELRLTVADTAGRERLLAPRTVVVEGNMKTGAFSVAFEDLKLPVAGIPITITRTYDSRDPRLGDFGPGWRLALNNIRVQKNRHLGAGWWQTPQQGSGIQFYDVLPLRDRIVTVVMPDGETHRFRAGAYVKNRPGDPDYRSFATVVRTGKYRFYPVGDTTAKLEPLNASNQLAEDFWIDGTGDQDLRAEDPAGNPFAANFNTSRYRLTTSDGTVFILDEVIGLLQMRDLDANTLVLNRDGANRVTGITATQNAPSGPIVRTVTIVRDSTGRVDYIRDLAGRDLDYIYDAQGRLASFTNRELNVTQFRYERSNDPAHAQFHYLTRIIDPRGISALRSEYDPATGKLVKQIDADGKETLFNRGIDGTGRFEKVKDRLGHETTFYYDERGNVTSKIDPLGAQTTFGYWPDSDRVKFETDHYGNVKSMAYDERGNVTVQTLGANTAEDPANPTTGHTTRTSYNAQSAPTQITDAEGRVQTFSYDPATNNLLTHTTGAGGPAPATTTYTYKTDGSLDLITDALGNLTSHAYNYAFSDPAYSGAVKQTTVTITDPAGAAGSDTSNATATVLRVTRTLFDAQENQLAQIITRTLPDGASEDVVTRYLYDTENRLKATVLPDGRVTETRYTSFGKEDKTVLWKSLADYQGGNLANARATSFGYDSRGNQTSITHADGTSESTSFDLENRKTWSQDRRGYRTFFDYDQVGRLRFTIQPDADDGIGASAPTTASDSRLTNNPRTETVYDLVGRVTDTYDELRRRTQTIYFPDGTPDAARHKQMVAVRTAGNLVTGYQYDKAGNVRFVTDPRGNSTETRYDEKGRPTHVIHPATEEHPSTQTETKYDLLGRRTELVDQEGKVTRHRYDALGRLIEVRQYLDQSLAASDANFQLSTSNSGIASTRYSYDALGNQQTQTDALARVTTYWTDKLGRRTQRILPKDAAEATSLTENLHYDEWGNLWKRTDFAGKVTTFGYDALNRLKSKTADATHPSLAYSHAIARVEYDYDLNGARNAARTFNASNTQLYAEMTPRDERGRIDYKDTAGGRLDYGYTANNRLKDVVSSNPGGVNLGYRYDEVNRLEYVDDISTGLPARTTGYTYNPNGSLETMAQPNGVVHTYGYDTLNRLRTLGVARGAVSLHTYDYKLRASGHRREVVEGVKTTTYVYDDLYRLAAETIANDPNANNGAVSYTLDKVGNRSARVSSLAPVQNQANTFNSRDWLGSDTYTLNGSTQVGRTVLGEPPGTDTYDFEERLILRTKSDGATININYDADGHRVGKNLLSATAQPVSSTSWLVDTNNLTGYCQVFEERVNSGADTTVRVYTYGSALISQATSLNGGSSTVCYFSYDGHGSTRELTSAAGTVTDRYDYDAFGILTFSSGTTANMYRYAGEQYDPDLGLYYNRARYLNPDSGRFWSMDSYEGGGRDPMSLHKYLYAHANPVSGRDPTGHWTLAEVMAVVVVQGIRIIPVATRITFFVAEAAGVSTIGYGAARGAVALGTAAERALPPGLSVGGLFSAAIQLPKGLVLGAHRFVKQAIAGSGMQSNHLNQSAAFPLAAVDDALTLSLQGSTATKGSQHYNFHRVLEEFWSKFRSGPLSFRPPTNGEYDDALREALAASDVPAGAIEQLVSLARASRRAAGYFDEAGGLAPNVPNPIPGVP